MHPISGSLVPCKALTAYSDKTWGPDLPRPKSSSFLLLDPLLAALAGAESLGEAAAKEIAGSTGGTVVFHQLDITDADSRERFATWLEGSYGGLTVLVNNAGEGTPHIFSWQLAAGACSSLPVMHNPQEC